MSKCINREENEMSMFSVNGLLKPTDNSEAENRYLGHFLKVSYIQEIAHNSVYSKDRVDVAGNGEFRFFIPEKEVIMDESVTIAVYAPDGEQLGSHIYSYGNLLAVEKAPNVADDTEPLTIKIDPKIIDFKETEIKDMNYKVSGKLVDISGKQNSAGVQIVVMASDDQAAVPGSSSFQAILSAKTDGGGYFYGRVENKTYKKAYGVVAGLEEAPILFQLEEGKLPANLILVANLSELSDIVTISSGTPGLPDGTDLVRSSSFSQDIGGKCVDFTVPNRTLEEFSFYHTVRTTEPEIKGLTITAGETKNLKRELIGISEEMFSEFGRLKDSLNTLQVVSYTVDEEKTEVATKKSVSAASDTASRNVASIASSSPVYYLKVASGTAQLRLSTKDLMLEKKGVDFNSLITLMAEQNRRKARLQELHQKLAAAYCGKNGLPEAQTYCESLASRDALDRGTLGTLLGHIKKYSVFVAKNDKLAKQFKPYLDDMEALIEQPFADSAIINVMITQMKKIIHEVDTNTDESQDQEELLGYLRRLLTELVRASGKVTASNHVPLQKRLKQWVYFA